jgi:predicted acylesterase/phospholipase RssA
MIKNLVISGGGVKIIGALGVIKYLDENNILKSIENYYGTSAGSILCLMLVLGFDSSEIIKFIEKFDLNKIFIVNTDNLFTTSNLSPFKQYAIKINSNETNKLQIYRNEFSGNFTVANLIEGNNLNTFINCNSSSKDADLTIIPTLVNLISSGKGIPSLSNASLIVLNFTILKGLLLSPGLC